MKAKYIWWPIGFAAIVVIVSFIVMWLWNWLMPELFGLVVINFWQALGLLILSKILFGGVWGHHKACHHGHHHDWKYRFKSKWQCMSEDERKKWEDKFAAKCKEHNNSGE
ncbi:MAG: hypothetical protein IPM74_08715 [Crocinitomicaceae bacterium]|nr:hypothetical protein [Crocinitomicaceae bacterium]